MKREIPIIALAVFSLSLLVVFDFYTKPAEAQLTFTTTNITYTEAEQNSICQYLDSSEVWCTSDDGIKIINPTSKSISQTLYSGIEINDVVCGSFCYSWHGGDTANGNLTKWNKDTHDIINSTTFGMSGGADIGKDIDIINESGAENLLFPASSGSCVGGVATTTKGLCIWDGFLFENVTRSFISSTDTGGSAILFGIKFAEETDVFSANVLIFFQDGSGTRTQRILDISDPDTTFANTQICTPTSATGLSAVNNIHIYVYNSKFVFPFDNGSTGLYLSMPVDSTTCGNSTEFATTGDVPVALITDGEFFYASSWTTGNKSYFQVYNGTSVSIATYNTTNTVAPALPTREGWYHSTEGEVQILGNSRLLTFVTQSPSEGGTIEICFVVEGSGQLICKEYETDENGNPIIPSVIGGVNPRNITDTSNDLFCSLGVTNCDNPDIETNGTGMLMLLILILVSYALVVYIHSIAKISVLGINPMLVLLIGIVDISIAFFLGWIPDFVFYTVIVLLVGLGGFGLYKIIRGG